VRRSSIAAPAAAVLLLLAGPGAAGACPTRAAPDPHVATWRAVNGFTLGAREASDAQIDRYLRALDRTSPRVRVLRAGTSAAGRPLLYAVAGEPRRLRPRALARLAARARAVRDGRLTDAATRAFAARAPLFAWVGGTVHGNEPSGGDADMRLLYELAAGRTCREAARRRALVTLVLPLQNPDGRAAGTHVSATRFDLNRDWFAATQPETQAKLAVLERYPPVLFADQHEEGGSGFFFPPNADPVHHEISAQALHAIDGVVGPALRRAFRAHHIGFVNYETFDLFFMGYGDTAPSTLFGAGGMTFEQGGDSAYPDKVAHHLLAADTMLGAATTHRRALLAGWARQWRTAAAQGARGERQPNRVIAPGDSVRFPVPAGRVYGYALRTDVHGADALALAHRLAAAGVRVDELTRPLAVGSLAPYGGAPAAPATLPAGTLVVPSGQTAKHWVEAMLAPDPYVPFPYFYDVCSWSNPLLMGLEGGALQTPVALPDGAARPLAAGDRPAEPGPGAAGYAFAGDAEGAAELAMALLADGTPVSRAADGTYATGGTPAAAAARARRVPLRALAEPLPGALALRRPRVALLGDTGQDDGPGDLSAGWARWLLDRRYGLRTAALSGSDLALGALSADDVLVVPDGEASPAELAPLALTRLRAWVQAGGTLVGWRGRGQAIAQAAGVTAVRVVPAPGDFQVPGAELRVTLTPGDPVARGEQPGGFVFNTGDPILAAHGAPVVAAYPTADRFYVSGYTAGTDVLRGTAAATDETVGAGRVVLFAFDPAFRGYTEGTERLLANALLAPPPGSGARRTRSRAVAPIDPAALTAAPPPHRDATVEVAAGDLPGLLRAARAAGLRGPLRIERDLSTATLRVPNPRGLAPEARPWTLRLPSALAAQGVRPLLAVF